MRKRPAGAVVLVIVLLALFSLADRRPPKAPAGRAASGDVITGSVVAVADGDTLSVLDEFNTQYKIRLFGIDAPEKSQAFGARSKEHLANLCFRKPVRVEVHDTDKYGRTVGRVFAGRTDVNMEQVLAGLAWDYRHYDKNHEFAAAELEAREQRRGLWADENPVPPWDYRRENHRPVEAGRPSFAPR